VPGPKGEPLSVAEWKRLPELPIVRIASEDESASVYTVIRAGFMPAKQADASAAGLSGTVAPDVPAGILPLPTATVASGEGGADLPPADRTERLGDQHRRARARWAAAVPM